MQKEGALCIVADWIWFHEKLNSVFVEDACKYRFK